MFPSLRVPSGILIAAFLLLLGSPAFSATNAPMPMAASNATTPAPVQLDLYAAAPFDCDASHYGSLIARSDGMPCVCVRFGDWKPQWLRLNPLEACWPEK